MPKKNTRSDLSRMQWDMLEYISKADPPIEYWRGDITINSLIRRGLVDIDDTHHLVITDAGQQLIQDVQDRREKQWRRVLAHAHSTKKGDPIE